MEGMIKIMAYIVLIFGIMGNTIVASVFLNGNYKNPEATSKILGPIMIITGTTDIAMLCFVAQIILKL